MVYNTCGRYSMYMYYIVYCQEIAHYNLKTQKKIKNMAALYINVVHRVVALYAPICFISRTTSLRDFSNSKTYKAI